MPVTLTSYDVNKTIYIYRFTDDWAWNEFLLVSDKMWDIIDASNHAFYLIFDLTQSNHIPIGVTKIIHRAGHRTTSPLRKLSIIVNPPAITPILLGAVKRIYPERAGIYHIVDTLEEASEMINTYRQSQSAM